MPDKNASQEEWFRLACNRLEDSVAWCLDEWARGEANYAFYRGEHLSATRVRLGEQRDAARAQYSEARCGLQASLREARRAGVEAGVLREYAVDGVSAW